MGRAAPLEEGEEQYRGPYGGITGQGAALFVAAHDVSEMAEDLAVSDFLHTRRYPVGDTALGGDRALGGDTFIRRGSK